jgi:hypothetical protein
VRIYLFIYLFICGLFTDTAISSDYIVSNHRMINELEKNVKGRGRGLFELVRWHLPGLVMEKQRETSE